MREALIYAFDFEWTNKTLFFGQYMRTRSYFQNSEMEAKGLPSPEELKILKPFKDQIPPRSSPPNTTRRRPTAPATRATISRRPPAVAR